MNGHADERKERTDTTKDPFLRQSEGIENQGEPDEVIQLRWEAAEGKKEARRLLGVIGELKRKLSQFHTDREHQNIQSLELARTGLIRERAQARASFDLLRGNNQQAHERWEAKKTALEQDISWLKREDKLQGDRLREMTTLSEKQSRIIDSQRSKLEELQQPSAPPFWVVARREAGGFLVMGPDKKTWFQSPVSLSKDPREGEANLGLCQRICELLNKAWGEGKPD